MGNGQDGETKLIHSGALHFFLLLLSEEIIISVSILERASGRMSEIRAPPLTISCMLHSEGRRFPERQALARYF